MLEAPSLVSFSTATLKKSDGSANIDGTSASEKKMVKLCDVVPGPSRNLATPFSAVNLQGANSTVRTRCYVQRLMFWLKLAPAIYVKRLISIMACS